MADVPANPLCSLMRHAQRHHFQSLLITCIRRLQKDLPISLDAFVRVHPSRRERERHELGGTPLTSTAESLFTIINMALELNFECLLPCAYYLILSRMPLEVSGMEVAIRMLY